jgi:NAD+ diphosphatase
VERIVVDFSVHQKEAMVEDRSSCYCADVHFQPEIASRHPPGAPGPWFLFKGSDLLVRVTDGLAEVPVAVDPASLGLTAPVAHHIGDADGAPCRAAETAGDAPDGWTFAGLRSLFSVLPEPLLRVAGRALMVIDWDRSHRFCGRCGTPTRMKEGERARECPACGELAYPRISPAIIGAVTRGDRLLLVRHHRFAQRFTVVAGYVEPGETLEECVHREVREETSLEISEPRYFANQPWPFPHSLMVGFTAEHLSGEIRVEPSELIEGGWFPADAMPAVPDRVTIARRLIDAFVGAQRPRT